MKLSHIKVIALALVVLVSPLVNGQGRKIQDGVTPNVYQVNFIDLAGVDRPLGAIVKEGSAGRVAYTSKARPEEDILIEFTVVSDAEMSKKSGRALVEISTTISKKKNGEWAAIASPSIYTDINSSQPAQMRVPNLPAFSIQARSIPQQQKFQQHARR